MSAVYALIAVICTMTVRSTWSLEGECSRACDLLRKDDLETSLMFQVSVNHVQYYPGKNIKVTASGHNATFPFRTVAIQAKSMGDFEPVGVMMGEEYAVLHDCNVRADGLHDTVCVSSDQALGIVQSMWHPPETAGRARNVEIQGVFIDLDGGIHHQHSVLLTENITLKEETVEVEVDLHSDRTEMELVIIQKEKDQKMIDMENIGSEDNLGIREREEEEARQREIHWEETQYEQALKEEEEQLRKRIQEELRDKEEYDRLKYEREQREREERERLEREREEREREEREREERERENNTIEKGPGEEIDIEDKSNDKQSAGSVRVTVTSGIVVLLSAIVLGM